MGVAGRETGLQKPPNEIAVIGADRFSGAPSTDGAPCLTASARTRHRTQRKVWPGNIPHEVQKKPQPERSTDHFRRHCPRLRRCRHKPINCHQSRPDQTTDPTQHAQPDRSIVTAATNGCPNARYPRWREAIVLNRNGASMVKSSGTFLRIMKYEPGGEGASAGTSTEGSRP
jgi:hypothetical protein